MHAFFVFPFSTQFFFCWSLSFSFLLAFWGREPEHLFILCKIYTPHRKKQNKKTSRLPIPNIDLPNKLNCNLSFTFFRTNIRFSMLVYIPYHTLFVGDFYFALLTFIHSFTFRQFSLIFRVYELLNGSIQLTSFASTIRTIESWLMSMSLTF